METTDEIINRVHEMSSDELSTWIATVEVDPQKDEISEQNRLRLLEALHLEQENRQ